MPLKCAGCYCTYVYVCKLTLLSCSLAKAQKAAKYAAMQAFLGSGGYRGKNIFFKQITNNHPKMFHTLGNILLNVCESTKPF